MLRSSEKKFKYFDVKFCAQNDTLERSVSVDCRFSADNLYFIGFCPSGTNTWYFLKGWLPRKKRGRSTRVTGLEFVLLELSCNYRDLELDTPREDLVVGKDPFIRAVRELNRFRIGDNQNSLRVHLLQICQIFCEAARIRPILNEIFVFYAPMGNGEGGILSHNAIQMQNAWARSCKMFNCRIFNEMIPLGEEEEEINMEVDDLNMAGDLLTVKRVPEVIYEKYQVGLTINTTRHNRMALTKKFLL